MELRRGIAESLESGKFQGLVARAGSRAWAVVAAQGLARDLSWPSTRHVIAIGGATLGGSGKTPLAIACALHLARAGVRVAIVGHAYRASPRCARVVSADDDVTLVGDEALLCARALAGIDGVRVVVAPKRQAALDVAFCGGAEVVILDGVLQTAPRRASLALLAVNGDVPWGAGACPPAGDLRAPQSALIGACDHVIRVGTAPSMEAAVRAEGAWLGERLLTWSELRTVRIGLITALARPARVVAMLAANGVHPAQIVALGDHAPRTSVRIPPSPVDLWLASAKCAIGLAPRFGNAPLATLDHALVLSLRLEALLDHFSSQRYPREGDRPLGFARTLDPQGGGS